MKALAPMPDPTWSAPVVEDQVPGVVASVERINAWMKVAKAGDRFVYATRQFLPIASTGRKRMLALAEAGLVCLTRPRSTIDPNVFHYVATRSSKSTAMTKPDRPRLAARAAPIAPGEAGAVDVLLPVIERFASAARPCPTDRQLASRAGIAEAHVPAVLEAMVKSHLIRIQGAAPPTYRRIVILATGATTGIAKK